MLDTCVWVRLGNRGSIDVRQFVVIDVAGGENDSLGNAGCSG